MNPLTVWSRLRWNQLNELGDRQHSLGSFFRRSLVQWPRNHPLPQWIPVVAVSEKARGYVVSVQLPQVKAEDVQIIVAEGIVTITGERKFDPNRKKDHLVRHAYGRFAHSFTTPPDARPAKVSAVFNKGVLLVHVAKNDSANEDPNRTKNGDATTVATQSPLAGQAKSPPDQ